MMRLIRKNFLPAVAVLGLAAIALVVGGYILVQQGARLPGLAEDQVRIEAELSNAQAVTPGQGQTVQVAGVEIGKISEVKLKDGRAVLGLDVEKRYVDEGLIRRDASALLRPRTPLRDMFLQVFPGSREQDAVGEGHVIPIRNTLPDVNLDEILAGLDRRTREYVVLLLDGTGKGLKGRGSDLAEVFKRFEPTVRDLGRVSRAVAAERRALSRTVSSFAALNGRLAERPEELSGLVTAANATFGAFASEDDNLRATVGELPGTLRQLTRTLQDVRPFADTLGPTTRALTPSLRALERANRALRPFAEQAEPIVRREIRPFARAARPVVRDLAPAARQLAATAPELRRGVAMLNRFTNLLFFNKGGREGPDDADRDEGYAFWLAWGTHLASNLINTDDANGPMRGIFLSGTCETLAGLVEGQPELEFGMALSPVLGTVCGNPTTRSVQPAKVRASLRKAAKLRAAAKDAR